MVYVVIAIYRCQPGSGDEVKRALREARTASGDEPGCRLCEVGRSIDDPDTFALYEQSDDQASYASHQATVHFRDIIQARARRRLVSRERSIYLTI